MNECFCVPNFFTKTGGRLDSNHRPQFADSQHTLILQKRFFTHRHTHTFLHAIQIFLQMDIFPHPPTPSLKSSYVLSHYTDTSQFSYVLREEVGTSNPLLLYIQVASFSFPLDMILLCCPRFPKQIKVLKFLSSSLIPKLLLKTIFPIKSKISNLGRSSWPTPQELWFIQSLLVELSILMIIIWVSDNTFSACHFLLII